FVRRGVLGRTAVRETAAAQAVAEAESRRKEVLLEAKEEAIRVRNAAEAEIRAQRGELKSEEQRLHSKEESLDRKLDTLEGRERKLGDREQDIENRVREVEELRSSQRRELEKVAQLSSEEARDLLLNRLEVEMRDE